MHIFHHSVEAWNINSPLWPLSRSMSSDQLSLIILYKLISTISVPLIAQCTQSHKITKTFCLCVSSMEGYWINQLSSLFTGDKGNRLHTQPFGQVRTVTGDPGAKAMSLLLQMTKPGAYSFYPKAHTGQSMNIPIRASCCFHDIPMACVITQDPMSQSKYTRSTVWPVVLPSFSSFPRQNLCPPQMTLSSRPQI